MKNDTFQLLNSALEARKETAVMVADSNDHCPTFAAKWARGDPVGKLFTYVLIVLT